MGTQIIFPSYNMSLGQSIAVVKHSLYDPEIAFQSKVLAIENVANMETHNSITKDELVGALRWLFEHYELDSFGR